MNTQTRSQQMQRGAPSHAETSVDAKRVYQTWKGSNIFLFGGRLIFGPDVASFLLTLVLILAPILVFGIFVGRHLVKDFLHFGGITILLVTLALTSGVLVFLLLTSGRDPGIIPRNKHPPEPEEECSSSSDCSGGQTPKLRLPRTKDVVVNGMAVKIKYCDTCMLYRPPRCSHCSICNNCVDRFDHHCPWVGQCIGRRNYRYFFLFILSTTLLCLFVFAMCALRIKKVMNEASPHTIWRALQRSSASAFLMAYTFLATWFVGGLTVFHFYLMSTNQTTYENFRYRYDKKANPYDQGMFCNIKDILCSSVPISQVHFRARVEEKTTDFGTVKAKPKQIENAFGPGSKNSYGNIKIGAKAPWMPTALDAFVQERSGLHQNYGGFSKEIRYRYEDDFVKGRDDSAAHGYIEDRSTITYSKHSSAERQSGIWEVSPEMPIPVPVVRGQGSHRLPPAKQLMTHM